MIDSAGGSHGTTAETMEWVRCNLCGFDDGAAYAEENGYRAVKCRRCGLVYLTPRPALREMKRLIEDELSHHDIRAHVRQRDLKCAQARWSLRLIHRFKARGALLEVGSAAGYLLWEARKAGYEVMGVDLTRPFVEFSTRVLGVPVHEGTLDDAPFSDASFDVVFMRNVHGHLAHPMHDHKRLHRLLRPGGFLIFETGNVGDLAAESAGELDLPDHFYHFGESTLRTLLARTGFQVRELHRYGLVAETRLGRILRGRRRGAPAPTHARPAESGVRLPRSSWTGRVEAAGSVFLRYGIGRYLVGPGLRSTLVVVAQRA